MGRFILGLFIGGLVGFMMAAILAAGKENRYDK